MLRSLAQFPRSLYLSDHQISHFTEFLVLLSPLTLGPWSLAPGAAQGSLLTTHVSVGTNNKRDGLEKQGLCGQRGYAVCLAGLTVASSVLSTRASAGGFVRVN